MPATIRLKRVGKRKQSSFRIVVAEKSTAISGPAIEKLGIYQPRTEPSVVRLDAERALHWLRSGALPSDTVKSIFRKTGLWEKYHDGITPEELTEKEIRLGPPEGQRQTSRRARTAASAREEADAAATVAEETEEPEGEQVEVEAGETAEPAEGEDEEEAAAAPDAEADEEEKPEASAEEVPEAEEAEAAEDEEEDEEQ